QVFVSAEIAAYEYDCTGHSRKADVLAAEYKAQCDGRRKDLPPRRLPTTTFTWTEPEVGRHSTQARFEGEDFPT
ncbi:MAG TPA: hypothetical protein VF391_00510, partial [Dermatophilaceae bacterium]